MQNYWVSLPFVALDSGSRLRPRLCYPQLRSQYEILVTPFLPPASCWFVYADLSTAPAQGILSQARLLGGSLGIAVSSVFLHRDISDNLTGIMTASEISMIGGPNTHLSAAQLQAIRKTYAKAFGMDMKAAVAVAALGIVCTAGAYRKKRLTIPEQRQALVAQHIADVRSATMEAETVQDKSAHSAPETCLPRSSIGV